MAINDVEIERIKKLQERITKADEKLNVLFKRYNIPDDITNSTIKLNYALSEIGDDQAVRDEFREKFALAQKEYEMTAKNIEEDFVNLTNIGNTRIERKAEILRSIEEDYNKKILEEENQKARITVLDEEIKNLDLRKTEILGPDGKSGLMGEEKSKANKAKNEASKLARDIADIDAKIKEIDEKIAKLNEANKNTNDPEELKKNAAEIAVLQGEKGKLTIDREKLFNERKDKQKEQKEHEDNITNLEDEVRDINSQIVVKSTEKNTLENELRLAPMVAEELRKKKEAYEKDKEEYIKIVDETEKFLNESGINVKASRIAEEPVIEETEEPVIDGADEPIIPGADEPIIPVADEPVKPVKDEPVKPAKDETVKPGGNSTPNDGQVYGQGEFSQGGNLPVITDEDRKRKNFEYIIGDSGDGLVLPSDDRLKRIQSELGGRDYEAMVKAFEELKKSPVKLTRDEKNKLKEMMKLDQKNIAQTVKDIDPAKLTKLFDSVGIQMSETGLKGLHFFSYERPSKDDDNYGTKEYGILDGFTSMTSTNKSKWEEVVTSYTKNKANMSPEEITDFEKYVMTPLKFGTLQEQTKEVCKNRFQKFFSKGGNKQVEYIRAAIAKAEVPEGSELSSTRRAKNFAESLKNQTEPNPPLNDRENRTEDERNRNGR